MNHYEKSRHTPDYFTLVRIAKVLKVPTAFFYAESDELAELIKLYGGLKKTEQMAALKKLRHELSIKSLSGKVRS